MVFGLFSRQQKFPINCPVCGLGFDYEISRQEFADLQLQGGVCILDESECPYCKHFFFTLTMDKENIITQERDHIQKIEQLDDRLNTILEMLEEEMLKPDGDAQRKAQLKLHAEATRKRISDMETEFDKHCASWKARREKAQL